MSELVALASLVEKGEPNTAVIAGADSPIPASLVPYAGEEAEDEFATEMLSPAERVMLQTKVSEEMDAAEYARRQLAALGGMEDQATVPGEPGGAAEAVGISDPAEYARRQLAQLSRGEQAPAAATDPAEYARRQLAALGQEGAGDITPVMPRTEPLDPRKQELARKFRNRRTGSRFASADAVRPALLRSIPANLRELMILDDDQAWWMMGVETDTGINRRITNGWNGADVLRATGHRWPICRIYPGLQAP
jgi:hypothetical protein